MAYWYIKICVFIKHILYESLAKLCVSTNAVNLCDIIFRSASDQSKKQFQTDDRWRQKTKTTDSIPELPIYIRSFSIYGYGLFFRKSHKVNQNNANQLVFSPKILQKIPIVLKTSLFYKFNCRIFFITLWM